MFAARLVTILYVLFPYTCYGNDLSQIARLMTQGATHRVSVSQREALWSADWKAQELQPLRLQLVSYYRSILNKRPSAQERLYVAREQAFAARFLAAAGELTPDDGAYVTQLIATPYFRSSWKRDHRTNDVLSEHHRALLLDSVAISGFTNPELLKALATLYLVKSDNPVGHKAAKILVARASESEAYRQEIASLIPVEDLTTKLTFLREKLSSEIIRLKEEAKAPGAKSSIPELIARRQAEMAELEETIKKAGQVISKPDCSFDAILN